MVWFALVSKLAVTLVSLLLNKEYPFRYTAKPDTTCAFFSFTFSICPSMTATPLGQVPPHLVICVWTHSEAAPQ